jgi:hypothetical protein
MTRGCDLIAVSTFPTEGTEVAERADPVVPEPPQAATDTAIAQTALAVREYLTPSL